jgi:quinol monooxygenase YgiN
MIVITVKLRPKAEHADEWPAIAQAYTEATRAEPGCLWFEWSRSVTDPGQYVLIEAFRDEAAGGAHVQSAHFKAAQAELPQYLQATPLIINTTAPGESWSQLGEWAVEPD